MDILFIVSAFCDSSKYIYDFGQSAVLAGTVDASQASGYRFLADFMFFDMSTRRGSCIADINGVFATMESVWTADFFLKNVFEHIVIDCLWLCTTLSGRFEMVDDEKNGYPNLSEEQVFYRCKFSGLIDDIKKSNCVNFSF